MDLSRLQRFQGCLVGVAVGDALGMPVEGWTREQIRQRFGVLREMVDGPRSAGSVTDDTMQTLSLAESLAELGHFDADDVMRRLLRWYRTDPFGIGVHTERVLSLVDSGVPWRDAVEQVERQYAPWTAGNGSLMRCAPIGLRYYRDIGGLLEYSHEASRLTHPNPLCRAACAFFNCVLARVLRGWDKNDALSFAMEVMAHAPHELLERVQGIWQKSADAVPCSGFVLDTLECALWAWWHHDDVEEALVTVVNLGGDTDTNAAVTGALMGAQCGLDAIPQRWREKVAVVPRCQELATYLYEWAEKE
ncbi:ADP-ribosyl-[dinitrogen reductase] glycohydrolase [bacterium HR17]|jgi:ADP-ribosyl-[dinitrogen reductase] hydrolase|uniref:ADP-ribosyl-[dinitrogen reductase] glycohydrolase n=1 Tax=Candidatus Fervidibacter japonicus TaxID=2035412 RepID=A0A2H5XF02_9BACT|nr:ADP-ribosyl-[dinitrogen reductase] glycohydrolase [bacterium HR17]